MPGRRIEKLLPEIIPDSIIGCIQRKGWMDCRTMAIWYDNVYKPYIDGHDGHSELTLDDFKCQRSSELIETMLADNAHRCMIPPHYTKIPQPCDFGINKPLKDSLKKKVFSWGSEKFSSLRPAELLPPPTRKQIVSWLQDIWEKFPIQIVTNSFTENGYFLDDTVDYYGDAESESDVEF